MVIKLLLTIFGLARGLIPILLATSMVSAKNSTDLVGNPNGTEFASFIYGNVQKIQVCYERNLRGNTFLSAMELSDSNTTVTVGKKCARDDATQIWCICKPFYMPGNDCVKKVNIQYTDEHLRYIRFKTLNNKVVFWGSTLNPEKVKWYTRDMDFDGQCIMQGARGTHENTRLNSISFSYVSYDFRVEQKMWPWITKTEKMNMTKTYINPQKLYPYGFQLSESATLFEICQSPNRSGISSMRIMDIASKEFNVGSKDSNSQCTTITTDINDCIQKIYLNKANETHAQVKMSTLKGKQHQFNSKMILGKSETLFDFKNECLIGIYGDQVQQSEEIVSLGFYHSPLRQQKSRHSFLGKDYAKFVPVTKRYGHRFFLGKIGLNQSQTSQYCRFKYMGVNNGAFVDLSHFKNQSNLVFSNNGQKSNLNYFKIGNNVDFVGKFCQIASNKTEIQPVFKNNENQQCGNNGSFYMYVDGTCYYSFDGPSAMARDKTYFKGFWLNYFSNEKTCLGDRPYHIELKGICSDDETKYLVTKSRKCYAKIEVYSRQACYMVHIDYSFYKSLKLATQGFALFISIITCMAMFTYGCKNDINASYISLVSFMISIFSWLIPMLFEPISTNLIEFRNICIALLTINSITLIVQFSVAYYQQASGNKQRIHDMSHYKEKFSFFFTLLKLMIATACFFLLPVIVTQNIEFEKPILRTYDKFKNVTDKWTKPKNVFGAIIGFFIGWFAIGNSIILCWKACLKDVMEEDPSVFPMEDDDLNDEDDDEEYDLYDGKELLDNKWEKLAAKEPDPIKKIFFFTKAKEVWQDFADQDIQQSLTPRTQKDIQVSNLNSVEKLDDQYIVDLPDNFKEKCQQKVKDIRKSIIDILFRYGQYEKVLDYEPENGRINLGYNDVKGARELFIKNRSSHRIDREQQMDLLLKEIDQYQQKYFKLPKWYKAWCLSNNISISQRPPEYVYQCMKVRNMLLKIISNKEWFILADPERTLLDCQNLLDEVIQAYKIMIAKPKTKNAIVNRNLIFGIPGEIVDAKNFDDWLEQQMKRQNKIQDLQKIVKQELVKEIIELNEQREQKFEIESNSVGVSNKNEGNQLSGVVRDVHSIWSLINFKDCQMYSTKEIYQKSLEQQNAHNNMDPNIHINSSHSTFSGSTTDQEILNKIAGEFDFFNYKYFEQRSHGNINLWFTGHGQIGYLSGCELKYYTLIDKIVATASAQSQKIINGQKLDKNLGNALKLNFLNKVKLQLNKEQQEQKQENDLSPIKEEDSTIKVCGTRLKFDKNQEGTNNYIPIFTPNSEANVERNTDIHKWKQISMLAQVKQLTEKSARSKIDTHNASFKSNDEPGIALKEEFVLHNSRNYFGFKTPYSEENEPKKGADMDREQIQFQPQPIDEESMPNLVIGQSKYLRKTIGDTEKQSGFVSPQISLSEINLKATTPINERMALLDHYELGDLIKSDKESEVYACIKKGSGEKRVVKVFKKQELDETLKFKLQDYIENYQNIKNFDCPQIVECFTDQNSYSIVAETHIDKNKYDHIPWGRPIKWNFNIYIDACHSGSAVKKFQAWINFQSKNRKKFKGFELEKKDPEADIECDRLYYFDHNSELKVELFTSCREEEVAFDEGEGKGSIWTNTFIAKNDFGDEMKTAELNFADGRSQQAQYYKVMFFQKR